ncbi:DUF4446 family protein [Candidatus Cryosericum terrychapinii]|uniref:DUF4446 family protein n=1 Tax=Candidatus Cryosericum terrychapinii TaxID=2290919 RepID=A0A398D2A7_9BACT|nr:DUF4446 family protein [Candidatus Cryosericum terrychapinii]RIE06928.1 DUF4446 family protein [Candidatus Cryosericum terrychapinii]
MEFLQQLYMTDGGRIGIAAAVLIAFGVGMAGLATAAGNRRLLRRIFGEAQGQQFHERLAAILRTFEDHTAMERELRESLTSLEQTSHSFFDTVDIEHYDAFQGQAGKFSFSLLMLNRNESGIILTSLTNTQGSKVYVKRIENGKNDTALSREEQDLLSRHARA